MEEEVTQVSAYNESGFQISRLHELWMKAEYFAGKGFLKRWKFTLDSIYREIYADILKRPEKNSLIKKNLILLKYISKSKTRSQLYFCLDERHRFLKEIQQMVGKGGLYKDVNDEDFD